MGTQAPICGSAGNFVFDGGQRGARIVSWSANLSHEINDTSGFAQAAAGYRTNKTGLKSMSGSAGGFLTKDDSDNQPNWNGLGTCDDGVSAVLTADSGCFYSGTYNISNIAIATDAAGMARITFDFVSNGAVIERWDVS